MTAPIEGAWRRASRWVLSFMALGAPALALRLSGLHLPSPLAALLFGLGIVGAAFLLSWAAEVAQLDVSASFAIAVLALIGILPEYAIEAVLAWKAGASFDPALGETTTQMQLVAANVTGPNRLLIGLGWSLVILVFWVRRRRSLDLRGYMALEMTMLVAATAVVFLLIVMKQIHIAVALLLVGMYVFYLWASSRREAEEPELMGVALLMGSLPRARRRALVVFLFLYSAGIILLSAEPFVESLVDTGLRLGIDEFVLIQWLAPLASESPEIIVAILFSLRANPMAGLSTLISAEVNQLTLLIGSMVVLFSLSAGQPLNFPLDHRQWTEFLLTAMVSVFAILLIAPRVISWRGGLVILGLFVAHLFFVSSQERLYFVYLYAALTVGLVLWDRRRLSQLFRAMTGG